ncbi:MAG: hypothetical protein Q7J42_06905 [Sulfuritalea sp.]|nr:hypothetical protein [Sulfuritalea sp.]
MSPTLERTIGSIIVVGVLAAWAYNSWVVQPEKQRQRYVGQQAEASQRFKDWAYVAREKEVAPGETVKLVVIPHPTGIEFMDTKCLIYTHREFKTSAMICPDAKQSDIEPPE